MLELSLREVEPDRTGTELRQGDRPLRRAAAELEDVQTRDLAENAELGLRDLGRPPGETAALRQLVAMECLVLVARGVPRGTVVGRVLCQPGRSSAAAIAVL